MLQVKVEQRKVHEETDPNVVLNWTRRPLDGGMTDEQRIHDKGQFEMKCQRRRANHTVKLDRVMQVLKMNCLRQERSAAQIQKEGATEIICHGEYGGCDISMKCML